MIFCIFFRICEFELYGTIRAVISACDSVNYITDDEDRRKFSGW